MIKVKAKYACGCCYATLQFDNVTSIERSFKRSGIDRCVTVIDDTGKKHRYIDTRDGFFIDNEQTIVAAEDDDTKLGC